MQKLLITPSPHIHTPLNTRTLMRDVIIALAPAVLTAILFYGWRFLGVLITSVGCCVLIEWAVTKYLLKTPSTIKDLSAALTGVLLALNLPCSTPLWIVAIGAIVAIGIAKMSFGGLGQNLFNPALVARVFLLISFPAVMSNFGVLDISNAWSFKPDAVTGPTILTILKEGGDVDPNLLAQSGSAGEISAIALLLGFAYLLVRKVIKPWITLSIWGTIIIFTVILNLATPDTPSLSAMEVLFTGGILLGSIFMATDYVTSPMSNLGGVIFGIGIGLLTMIIRTWGSYPEGVSFAILIMNAFVPLINKCCKARKFGRA